MNILLVYPEFPDTFWSFRYALQFIHKKSGTPPLGLLPALIEWRKGKVGMPFN